MIAHAVVNPVTHACIPSLSKLIFDIGFHKGEDTAFYLSRGYNVVAVDADPGMVALATETFKSEVAAGRLTLLHLAICDRDNECIDLHLSELSLWNSLQRDVADRCNRLTGTIKVPTSRLDSLLMRYPRAHYCKVDIEGSDTAAAATLIGFSQRPEYISVETECIGEHVSISEEEALETLRTLHAVGYTKFKLVEQQTLRVLDDRRFFGRDSSQPAANPSLTTSDAELSSRDHLAYLRAKHGFAFPLSASGPFGQELEGEWIDYGKAKDLLLFHRHCFFEQEGMPGYAFWCDWHASGE